MSMSFDEWLERHGLGRHAALFAENDIGFDVVADLTEDDLRELGLSIGDRKRLMREARNLTAGGEDAGHRSAAPMPAAPMPAAPMTAAPAPAPAVATPATPPPLAEPPPAAEPATEAPAVPAGGRRQVTVLFADISGFTTMTDRLDPEEVHGILARYFEVVDGVVRSFGGSIDKHIGDAVMAVFGAPVAHSNDPERAVRAAIEIHHALGRLEPPLSAHVGIASGQVVADRTGSQSFEEYTVTGVSVNLASRLQDKAGSGETLVSDAVHEQVAGKLRSEPVGEVEVRGLERPVGVWRVLGLEEVAIGGGDRPFVGRRRELLQLSTALTECLEARAGQLVLVRGEPGIGKTRLIDRFEEQAAEAGFARHRGLVLDFGAGKGREAVPALVRGLLGIPLGGGKAVRRAAADAALVTGLVAQDAAVHLNELLDLAQPAELEATFAAMSNRARVVGREQVLTTLVAAAAACGPLFLRIEDIHWADAELLDQLAAAAVAVRDLPVVIVMTTRVEGDPLDAGWRMRARGCPLTTIDLGPLRADEARELAERYLQAADRRVDACIERAAGNPLFLDQLLRNADERADTNVPGSVQSIVQARLDNLAPLDRAALEAASVLGQRFAMELVGALIDAPDYDGRNLVDLQLVRPEGDEFLFAHALVRDGVYGSLLREPRRVLHRRAADLHADRDRTLAARHLDAAEDPGAADAYLTAAREQLAAYRYDRALPLAERGREIASEGASDGACAFELTMLRAEALGLLGRNAEAIDAYAEALEATDAAAERARAHLGRAGGMRVLDDFDGAFRELDAAQALAAGAGLDALRAQCHFMRGNLCFPLGRLDECQAEHTAALDAARSCGRVDLEVQALGGLGDAAYIRGRIRTANANFTLCVELAHANGFGRIEVANWPMVAWSALLLGDYAGARTNAEQARLAAERVGDDRSAIIAWNAVAMLALDDGDADAAVAASRQIVDLSERLNASRLASFGLNTLGMALLLRGDRAGARAAVSDAMEAARAAVLFVGPWIHSTKAAVQDDRAAALDDLAAGEALLQPGVPAHNHFFYRRTAIDVCLHWRNWDEAVRHADALEAYVGAESTGWTRQVVAAARGLAARGRGEAGAEVEGVLEAARRLAGEIGMVRSAAVLDAALTAGGGSQAAERHA